MGIVFFIEKYLWLLVTICYSYQLFYILYVLAAKKETNEAVEGKDHKFGIIISARNEENVIGQLIDSIDRQNYPSELIDVLVIADNCTDNTANLCRQKGAIVFERFNKEKVGKGYALRFLFENLFVDENDYDAYIVIDADNLLDKNYIKEMNAVYNKGYRVVTSYRNSKNYASNWISAGYSLWFLRESKYLNEARMRLHTSGAISGTGFLISKEIIEEKGGWPYYLLTEDIEFTTDYVIEGKKVGYAKNAILYDEQPVTFKQSWDQRLRWAKGFYQVIGKYGKRLAHNIVVKRSFSCFDILMSIFPAVFLTMFSISINIVKFLYALTLPKVPTTYFLPLFTYILSCYAFIFVMGLITTITEWKNIHCKTSQKIFYLFTFPLFMLTYVPIAIVAMFKKVQWKPIAHSVTTDVEQMEAIINK